MYYTTILISSNHQKENVLKSHQRCVFFKCWVFPHLYSVMLYVWSNKNNYDFRIYLYLYIPFNRIKILKVLKPVWKSGSCVNFSNPPFPGVGLCVATLITIKVRSLSCLSTSFEYHFLGPFCGILYSWTLHEKQPNFVIDKSLNVTEALNTIQIYFYSLII